MQKFGLILLFLVCCGFYISLAEEWIELSSLFGVAKPFRQGHSAIMTPFGRMVSFSGLDNTLTGSQKVTRYDYLTNSQLNILQDVDSTNKPSRQRSGYGCWQERYLVQFAGSVGGQNSKELLIFDSVQGIWFNNVTTSLGVNPTYNTENHFVFGTQSPSAAVDNDGDNLWVYGGLSTILNLNFVTRIDLTTYEFFQINLTNTDNQPLRKHAAAMAYSNNFLWLYGGRKVLGADQDIEVYNELRRFDIAARAWAAPAATGTAPSARAFMATCVLKDGVTWILFGGSNDQPGPTTVYNNVYRFTMTGNGAWSTISPTGTPPTGRDKLVAVHLGWDGEDSVLFHGGADAQGGSLNAFWKLQITSNGTGPVEPPPTLDQDADVADDNSVTNVPPSSSSSVSATSSTGPVQIIEDEAATTLTSWLSLLL